MPLIVGIKFRNTSKTYYFGPKDIEFKVDDGAIVETARGIEYGKVTIANTMVPDSEIVSPLKDILRKATPKDEAQLRENIKREETANKLCLEKIAKHNLEMKLVNTEYTFDRSKVIFYFTAEGRIDFRELVQDLANALRNGSHKIRVEMRQIYERDDIKMRGALAMCGRPCCCGCHLQDFEKVSIKMAKNQGLSLNPSKISGVCGKLMCCLKYENDYYVETNKLMPKVKSKIKTADGVAFVESVDVLKRTIKAKIETSEGNFEIREYKLEDIQNLSKGTLADDVKVESKEEKELKKLKLDD